MSMNNESPRDFLIRIRALVDSAVIGLENNGAATLPSGENVAPVTVSILDMVLENIDDYSKNFAIPAVSRITPS